MSVGRRLWRHIPSPDGYDAPNIEVRLRIDASVKPHRNAGGVVVQNQVRGVRHGYRRNRAGGGQYPNAFQNPRHLGRVAWSGPISGRP